ncbi:MAG: Dihydrolipoyl dehydrogenase [Elusimicrobia bacterium]|nr:Dihydrolipoyl dehydrogenase [Elusimicrobiota bacterium]
MKLVIIGAGPAGEAAAKTARALGSSHTEPLDITLIEKEEVGGLCLNKGCIPSKTLLEEVRKRVQGDLPITWPEIQSFKTEVVSGIRGQLENAFKTQRIKLIKGSARFNWPSSLEIVSSNGTQTIHFDKAIIATGTASFFPPPLDQFRDLLWDSDRMLNISHTPKSIIIVGGGAVGCEFACLLNAAGAKVTLIELKDNLLPGEDPQIAEALAKIFEARGMVIKTGNKVVAAERNEQGWQLALSKGDILQSEEVLVCVGRLPVYKDLNLDSAGIRTENNRLVLDDRLHTTNPNVLAAGDAATTRLAHAAAVQGEVAAINALGGNERFDDSLTPRCLYSWPEVASVGKWKYQLEEANKPVKTTRAFFKGSSKALASKEAEGFVQIVFDPDTGKIFGAQIIGPHATELIHNFSIAIKTQMTLKDLKQVMFAHPTLSEVIRDAARR